MEKEKSINCSRVVVWLSTYFICAVPVAVMLKMVQQLEREIFFALGGKQKKNRHVSVPGKCCLGLLFFFYCWRFFCAGKNIEYKVNNPLKRTSKCIKPNGKIIFYSWPQKWHGSSRTNYIHIHLSLIYEFSRMYDVSNPIKELSLQLSAWSCILLVLLSFKTLPTIPAALYALEVRFILQRSHSRCLHWDIYPNSE